jgi:peptide/nickel transport system substrate-binding protein
MADSLTLSRRALLGGGAAALGVAALPRIAIARGRVPLGGKIALHVPWPIASVDPHRLDDVASAIFGDALFDTLYARDDSGAIVPSLAESDPEPHDGGLRVVVRSGLKSAHGRPIDARDAAASITRARSLGARAWLADLPTPKIDKERTTLQFAVKDAARLARTLASPLVAIVPISFTADRPDGTGPMRADRRADALVLTRNGAAARGGSLLDEIAVRASADVSTSLRSFENGSDDIGWLGTGYHEPRAGARTFDLGVAGWAVLRTGRDAGTTWDAPGVAQSICNAIPHADLSALVIGPAWTTSGSKGWGGPPCDLFVRDDAPWLIELAKTLAGALSVASHEVTSKPIAASDLAQRRASRAYALALDVVRPLAGGHFGALAGLATSDSPATAADVLRHAPKGDTSARALTQLMHVGVVGEVRVQGGRVPDLTLPAGANGGIDWSAASRARR